MTTDTSYQQHQHQHHQQRQLPQQNFYQILSLDDQQRSNLALPPKDLRTAYKRALLAHHPDKHGGRVAGGGDGGLVTVDQIALAYNVLSDRKLRKEYDDALLRDLAGNGDDDHLPGKFKIFHTGLETFDLDDLKYLEDKQVWTRPCRCGDAGGFVLTEDGLEAHIEDGEILTGCKGCSLWIKVLFSIDN